MDASTFWLCYAVATLLFGVFCAYRTRIVNGRISSLEEFAGVPEWKCYVITVVLGAIFWPVCLYLAYFKNRS